MHFSKKKITRSLIICQIFFLFSFIHTGNRFFITVKPLWAEKEKDNEKTDGKESIKIIKENIQDVKENVKEVKDPGKVIKEVAEKKEAPKPVVKEKYFTLNFKNVEIEDFLNIMSQFIGKNIILDDKIKGKITINSAKRIPISQAYDVLKSILEVKGLAIVESSNLIKVIPITDALKKNAEIIIDGKKTEIVAEREDSVTFLLELKFADAAEVSGALATLKSKYMTIVVYKSLNTLIFSGASSEVDGLVKITKALDKKIEELIDEPKSMGNIHVVHLENANSDQLAEVLSRVPFSDSAKIETAPRAVKSDKTKRVTQTQTPTTPKASKLSIISNKDTNSLIISASPDEFKEIQRLIKELDIVREQVLIEALIVEVGVDSGWGFGIDWMLGNKVGSSLVGGSSIMNGFPNYVQPPGIKKQLILPISTGFQLGYLSDTSILSFALLNASGSKSNVNILSTPQILTIDNQEAELNVGEEVPVQQNARITETNAAYYTWGYKPVGIKLKITPHITKNQRITIDLYQEVNTVLDSSATDKPPKLGKRDIKTKITVLDGKTIVVGGLIRNNKSVSETKVPLLGDIPLLGWIFKHKSVTYSKTNLLVFITPYIVTKDEKIDKITNQKRSVETILKND